MALPQRAVQKDPSDELQDVRARNGWNLVPEDGARLRRVRASRRSRVTYTKVFDALRVKVNFAAVITGEALEQLRERSLCAMVAVDERRSNGEPQVSESSVERVALRGH